MHDVIIIGAGPAGLSAARTLRANGVDDVIVVEREQSLGGVPRHCGHWGFGWREFRRIMTGPNYIKALSRLVGDVDIRTGITALSLGSDGRVSVAGTNGVSQLQARRILVATGNRETPRSARLVGGTRPFGVMTTGTLQQFAYIEHFKPFCRPVIIGSELVSFSAILTCRDLGIKPVAMIEERARITARHPGDFIARHLLHVPLLLETSVKSIEGQERVEAVIVDRLGMKHTVKCDGVIFTGQFVPEIALFAGSSIELNTGSGGPSVDEWWRTSDPCVFAAGNVVHPVETAGRCWRDGLRAGMSIWSDLSDPRAPPPSCALSVSYPIRYIWPQWLSRESPSLKVELRLAVAARGHLQIRSGERILARQRFAGLPERRIAVSIKSRWLKEHESLHLSIVERNE